MRRLYFGGTFNPIHHGHLIPARAAAEQLGFERVTLIPAHIPPHKPNSATMADTAHRLAMAVIAVAGDPLFEVSDIEASRPGASYTLDTVRALKAKDSQPVHWLIGADMLMYLPKWHQPLQLLKEVNFVIAARPGWTIDWNALPPQYRHLQQNVVTPPLVSLTASEIRARVAAGKSIRYLTPDSVCQYIEEHKLYRQTATPDFKSQI